MNIPLVNNGINNEEICLVDSATTHTILKDKKIFLLFSNARSQC